MHFFVDLHPDKKHGLLAEWLGGGLQNRRRRFESARDLSPYISPAVIQYVTGGFFMLLKIHSINPFFHLSMFAVIFPSSSPTKDDNDFRASPRG